MLIYKQIKHKLHQTKYKNSDQMNSWTETLPEYYKNYII